MVHVAGGQILGLGCAGSVAWPDLGVANGDQGASSIGCFVGRRPTVDARLPAERTHGGDATARGQRRTGMPAGVNTTRSDAAFPISSTSMYMLGCTPHIHTHIITTFLRILLQSVQVGTCWWTIGRS